MWCDMQVLDELLRVMRVVDREPCPPRANELLQELRDISSMAMEHFDEKIVPLLKAQNSNSLEKTPRLAPYSEYGEYTPLYSYFNQYELFD